MAIERLELRTLAFDLAVRAVGHDNHAVSYRIRRFYKQGCDKLLPGKGGLTLADAQAHCRDPETSSSTCTRPEGKEHTERYGEWFDAYEADPGR